MSTELTTQHWEQSLQPLVGRTIKRVRYMQPDEVAEFGWCGCPVVLELDDGTLLYPVRDDEGNDAGMLGIQPGKFTAGIPEGAPVL